MNKNGPYRDLYICFIDGEEGDEADPGMGQRFDMVYHVDEMQVKGAGHKAKGTRKVFSAIVMI